MLRKIYFVLILVILPFAGIQNIAHAKEAHCGKQPSIYLDIGHSPRRWGATSASGKTEYSFNRHFVKEFARLIRSESTFRVTILNPTGRNISLRARANSIRRLKRGILLSIHHDSAQSRYIKKRRSKGRTSRYSNLFSGYSLFISNRTIQFSASKRLALTLGSSLQKNNFLRSLHHTEKIRGENRPIVNAAKGVFRYDSLAILNRTRIPAVLVEVGVIINPHEERKLLNSEYKKRFMTTMLKGVQKYCGLIDDAPIDSMPVDDMLPHKPMSNDELDQDTPIDHPPLQNNRPYNLPPENVPDASGLTEK